MRRALRFYIPIMIILTLFLHPIFVYADSANMLSDSVMVSDMIQKNKITQRQLSDSVRLLDTIQIVTPVPSTGGPDYFGYVYVDSNGGGTSYSWVDITGTGTEILALADTDDSFVSNISIGFTFNYYGTDYTTLAVTNNGLSLVNSSGISEFVNEHIGLSGAADNFIAPFWDDLVTFDPNGTIYYQTLGTAPNRTFVVEWYDNAHYPGDCSSTCGITFEVILFENSTDIKFQYMDVDFDDPEFDNGLSATVGIEGPTGQGLEYSFDKRAISNNLAILFTIYHQTSLSDSVMVSDMIQKNKITQRQLSDSVMVSDMIQKNKITQYHLSDSVEISDRFQTTKIGETEFVSVAEVPEGESIQVTLPPNEQGSENTVEVDLPDGVAADVIITTTDEGESDPDILFLGTILDIDIDSTSTDFTFTVRLSFTDDDLEAAGLTLDQVSIFHDSNENGSFEEDEAIATTITPSSPPGPYTAEADVPSNSKFAIGGTALALFGGLGIDSSGPPSFDSDSFTIVQSGGFGGLLKNYQPVVLDGKTSGITLGFKMPGGLGELNHVGLYTNIKNGQGKYDADTYIYFDKYNTPQVTIHDPNGFFKSTNVGVKEASRGLLEVNYDIDFTKSMGGSDVVFEAWNNARQSAQIEIPGLLDVSDSIETPQITEQTQEQIIKQRLVPEWIKSNAEWWGKDQISDETFTNGIGFLIQKQIIDVPELIQTNISPDKTQPEKEELTPRVPNWVKNTALWWSEDKLTDDEFLRGIKYLLQEGIIQVKT